MIDAMKQAMYLIEAWERGAYAEEYPNEIAALRQAIEQAEKQEPVAWMYEIFGDTVLTSNAKKIDLVLANGKTVTPLYTAPQKYCPSENNAAYEKGFVEGMAKQMHSSVDRVVNAMTKPWVGLTDKEIVELLLVEQGNGIHAYTRAIEAKLREKNA